MYCIYSEQSFVGLRQHVFLFGFSSEALFGLAGLDFEASSMVCKLSVALREQSASDCHGPLYSPASGNLDQVTHSFSGFSFAHPNFHHHWLLTAL
jgi:hypothetical protein